MEPSQKDLYSVLNVPRTATPEQIRSAYRELTKAFLGASSGYTSSASEADSNQGTSQSGKSYSLQDISTAFNVLSNPIKRAEYDVQFNPLVEGRSLPLNNNAVPQTANGSATNNNGPSSDPATHLNSPANQPLPEAPSAHPERLGRGNNTEFITNKPAAAFNAGTGLRGPFGITDSHLARADSHKIKPMKDMLGPIFSDRKRMPPGVFIAIVTGSLSIGIIIALVVRSLIHG